MPRTAVIQIRVSDAEKRAIRAAAAAAGVDLTTYLRRLALEHAAEHSRPPRPLTAWERYEQLLAAHRATTADEEEAVQAAQWELALRWPSDFQRIYFRLGLHDRRDHGDGHGAGDGDSGSDGANGGENDESPA